MKKKVWLTFDFGDEQNRYNMAADDVAGVCDDLGTDFCEHMTLYWYDHCDHVFKPVLISTEIEER